MKRILFAGAGHANLVALDLLTRRQRPAAELVLITSAAEAHYSGMVPGYIEGLYGEGEFEMPLAPFCRERGIELLVGEIESLHEGGLRLRGGPLEGDVTIVNLGAVARRPKVLQGPRVVPAKPFATLMAAIPAVIEGKSIAVIGAGPAGLEVAFALKARRPELEITIVERAETLLPAFPRRFAQRIRDHLDRVGIGLSLAEEVVAVLPEDVRLQSGKSIASEGIVAFTGAAPPKILETAPFARSEDGFIAVDNTMRSVSHPNVLAVGDVATRIDDPRPKAGVFAVRSGPLLARAVTDLVEGRPLRPAPLQKRGLVLLSLGGRRAVGVRNGVVVEGRLVWRLKDRFDRAFVDRFRVS